MQYLQIESTIESVRNFRKAAVTVFGKKKCMVGAIKPRLYIA
jgi:hypothetical protein